MTLTVAVLNRAQQRAGKQSAIYFLELGMTISGLQQIDIGFRVLGIGAFSLGSGVLDAVRLRRRKATAAKISVDP
jgi:hypothetical protein